MLLEKGKTKTEIMQNLEIVAKDIIKNKVSLGKYFLNIIVNYILEQNEREEGKKIIDKIENERGENKDMLNMIRVIEEENASLRREGRKEGRKEGYKQAQKEIAKTLLKRKMTLEEIAQITRMTISEIEKI